MHAELTIQPVLVAHTPVGCTVDIEEEEGGTQEAAQGAAGPGELDLGDDAFRNRLIGPLWEVGDSECGLTTMEVCSVNITNLAVDFRGH